MVYLFWTPDCKDVYEFSKSQGLRLRNRKIFRETYVGAGTIAGTVFGTNFGTETGTHISLYVCKEYLQEVIDLVTYKKLSGELNINLEVKEYECIK